MSQPSEIIHFTVIGAGVCGLLTAIELRTRFPDKEIVLIDSEPFPGHHNTTRNSGVLHAGIYYPTGSLKHDLCMRGHRLWQSISKELKIPMDLCGKFVIATQESELPVLHEYYQNAQANGVPGIQWMTSAEKAELSQFTTAIAGFYSPQTGILDISSGINLLFQKAQEMGVICLLQTKCLSLKKESDYFQINTSTDSFQSHWVINCAGMGAVDIRQSLGLTDIQNLLVKGNYVKLNKKYYTDKLIYPVPLKNLKGLGVHTSFHMDRIVRFGPNTEDIQKIDYSNSDKNIDILWPSIQEKFKGIQKSDLSIDYTGIRTKILKHGQLYSDFLIQGSKQNGIPNYIECLGIESPGMTAAPAIATKVADLVFS